LKKEPEFIQNPDKSIEQNEYDGAGKLKSKTVIIFNEAGKEVSSSQRTADGKLSQALTVLTMKKVMLLSAITKIFIQKSFGINMMKIIIALLQELFDGTECVERKIFLNMTKTAIFIHEQTYEMDTNTRVDAINILKQGYEYVFKD